MFKFCLFLIVFILFCRWFFYDNNPYKTYMYVGKKGSGKTSYIAKLALQAEKRGIPFYTNVEGISNTFYFDASALSWGKLPPNSIVALDEIGLIYDARNFKSFEKGVNVFYKYSRQYKCTIHLFSQAFASDTDLKVRNMVDRLYLMKRLGRVTILRPVSKKLGVVKRVDGTGNLDDSYAYSNFLWIGCKMIYLPRYYGLFKTFNPPDREIIQASLQTATDLHDLYKSTLAWIIYSMKTSFKNRVKYVREKAHLPKRR